MLDAQAVAAAGHLLGADAIRATLEAGLGGKFKNARVLALIPDHTRTLPLPQLFPMMVDILADTARLDFMVALGTHPPLSDEALRKLVGITSDEQYGKYAHVGILNHEWNNPDALLHIGTISDEEFRHLAGDCWHETLAGDLPVHINRHVVDYDQILILGPTFPHEVVGFSGGAKYLFPGIAGAEIINKTHWLGALITIMGTIGCKQTPMRDIIHTAARFVSTPVTLISLVVEGEGLAGLFVGGLFEAYEAAADLSAQRHITWLDQPFQRVLSCAPPMYDELWTGGKAMYKLEQACADGGELVIYAPHLEVVSHVHGKYLYRIGYHVRDYFLRQWDRFGDVPLGIVAHSTHVRGVGRFERGVEQPRIQVTLASKISPDDCKALNLGYRDPASIDPAAWASDPDTLVVPKAGEMLYKVKSGKL